MGRCSEWHMSCGRPPEILDSVLLAQRLSPNITNMLDDDISPQPRPLLKHDPAMTRGQLAQRLGLSMGEPCYALRAPLDRGWMKARNSCRSQNRQTCADNFHPHCLRQNSWLDYRSLKHKCAGRFALLSSLNRYRCRITTETFHSPQSPKQIRCHET